MEGVCACVWMCVCAVLCLVHCDLACGQRRRVVVWGVAARGWVPGEGP